MSRHCPWCASAVVGAPAQCTVCGGDLPPAPDTAGPPPPPPPRSIPAEYRRRVTFSKNVFVLIGVAFGGFGLLFGGGLSAMALAFDDPIMFIGAGFGSIFGVVGVLLLRKGLREARAALRALEHGLSIVGTIREVGEDTTVTINSRHPWKIEYAFEVDGRAWTGRASAWEPPSWTAGQTAHVVYLAEDPAQNTLYPPVR